MKDASPASTRSSSPQLDWMIKRGMVGLCLNTCHGVVVAVVGMLCVSLGSILNSLHVSVCGEDIFGLCGYAFVRARLV